MKLLPLSQGKFAIISDVGYAKLMSSEYRDKKWSAQRGPHTFYAATQYIPPANSRRLFFLHRFLLDAPAGSEVDHRDGNGLNNLETNLRLATVSTNQQNRRKWTQATSRFKGVYWNSRDCRWTARIGINKKRISLGNFRNEKTAACAYDAAAKKYFGEFACLNFSSLKT